MCQFLGSRYYLPGEDRDGMLNFPQRRKKLTPPLRLRRKSEFVQVFKQSVIKGEHLQIWIYKTSKTAEVRLSIITSRKVSTRATERNLWKRRIREILRKEQFVFKSGVHIIIKVKAGQRRAPSSADLKTEIFKLLELSQSSGNA